MTPRDRPSATGAEMPPFHEPADLAWLSEHQLSRRSLLRATAAALPVLALAGCDNGDARRPADLTPAYASGKVITRRGGIFYEPAQPADELAASVGVNIHLNFADSVYAQVDRVVAVVAELGVRRVRDRVASAPSTRRGFTALGRQGVRVQGLCGAFGDPESMAQVMREVVTAYPAPDLLFAAFEGINEPNNNGRPWIRETRMKIRDLHEQRDRVGLRQVPVVAPALARVNSGGAEGDDTEQQAANLGSLVEYVDLGNIHVYPRDQRPSGDIDRFMGYERQVTGKLPMVCSEGGYFTAMDYRGGAFPTPEDVCAVYMPRLFMEHWIRGNRRFYIYELLDDYDPSNANRESSFGLLRVAGPGSSAAWTPKLQFRAVQNFVRILRDPGPPVAPRGLRLGISDVQDLKASLVAKRDGSWWLLLWRDVASYDPARRARLHPEALVATIRFPRRHRVRLYRPTSSALPTHSFDRVSSVRVPVDEELVIAQID